MKYSRRSFIALGAFTLGGLAGVAWSARLGRRVWSPRVLAWRNPLRRPPAVENRPDSPLRISDPRHYAFWSVGSAVGGVLTFAVGNASDRHVHSYACRHYSPVPSGNGAYGSRPPGGLPAGQSRRDRIARHDPVEMTLTIDFVQFSDGATWFSSDPGATVKPEGVGAGARAAAAHLLGVLERDGPAAVMAGLPRIHADVRGPFGRGAAPEFGSFGFYSGVTNMVVRVEDANAEGGLERVAAMLRAAVG